MASSLVMDGFRQRPLPGGGSKTSPLKRGEHSSTVLKRPSAQPLHPDDDDKMSSLTRAVANEPEPNVKLRIEAAYRPTTKDMEPAVPRPERWATMAFAVLGVLTRFFRISAGKYVLWDEAHFGKFGSHYLKHTFYFDVHPPLGKMLVGLAGYLAGYDGSFEFGSGSDYPSTVNYVGMRLFLALFSALAVPMAYLTAVQLRLTRAACYLVGLMTLLDVGFIGIGRLVLLDSMLVFFTTATAFYYCQFRNQQSSRPFGVRWWLALAATGICIGCVSSVKWVGLLATTLVGLLTIEELWHMLGQYDNALFMKHFASRALGLIVIPVGIYVGSFHVHFRLLHKSGPGDANMSSLFQAQRQGSDLAASPIDVAYGGVLTFKSRSYGGGLLHSHVQTYPQGSKQQQVTTYHHKDHNNEWIIVPSASDLKNSPLEQEADDGNGGESMRLVREGERVKLRHKSTGKYLHSHVVEAPLTKGDYEVSSYGSNERELEDPNDYWRVELVSDAHPGAKRSRHLRSLSTHFRLKHVQTGCYLRSRNLHLPEWGFKQGEVTCARQPSSPTGREFLWNVESQVNDKLPRGDASQYRSRFLDDVRDCNVGMWLTNNALTPNPELEPGILTSTARDWFWMRKGIRMSGWDDARTKFYMLGTPMVWQASSISIVSLLAILALLLLLSKRHVITLDTPGTRRLLWQARIGLGGWALHYLPFFLIGRVLYLHHYYPALTFAILCSGILFDYATVNMGTRHRWAAFTIMAVAIVANYVYFSPLCYGMNGPAAQYQGRRWLSSWNL